MNQAYVFIKPHAVDNQKVVQFVKDVFAKNNIRILSSGEVYGADIDRNGLIDKHYAVNAHVGTIENPSELHINDAAKQNFYDNFNEQWDDVLQDGRVYSGLYAQRKLGIATGAELRDIWDKNGTVKVTGGMYVSFFKEDNIYVLNGFYPSIREIFTARSARLITFIVEFNSADLNWFDFRHKVIGVTDPSCADSDSIRGYMHAHGVAEFGMNVTCGNNVIHASASPFEAFVEKTIWIDGFQPETDPLQQVLGAKGISEQRIIELFNDNPFIEYKEENDHLVDVLEDKDTPLVAEIIASI